MVQDPALQQHHDALQQHAEALHPDGSMQAAPGAPNMQQPDDHQHLQYEPVPPDQSMQHPGMSYPNPMLHHHQSAVQGQYPTMVDQHHGMMPYAPMQPGPPHQDNIAGFS